MKNFKSTVPAALQEKIKNLIELADFSDIVTGWKSSGLYGCENFNEIEGNYVSGWIPRQDGGFQKTELCQNETDASYYFTENQADFANEHYQNCWESFLSDNDLDSETDFDNLTEEQQENLYEYESEWFEPALLTFEAFAQGFPGSYYEEEEQTVNIRFSINYKDAPYYREKYAEDIKTEVLTVAEFMQQSNEEILNRFKI